MGAGLSGASKIGPPRVGEIENDPDPARGRRLAMEGRPRSHAYDGSCEHGGGGPS